MKEHFCPVEQSTITYQGKCNWCGESEGGMTEPFAWFRYQQGGRVYYDTKKWDDCQPLYTKETFLQLIKELRPAIKPLEGMGKGKTTSEWFDILVKDIEEKL